MYIYEKSENNTYYSLENKYIELERRSPSQYNRISIDGSIVGCSKCVGYCQYQQHAGFLTNEQRKNHDCINKQCHHYIPKPHKEVPKKIKTKVDYTTLIKPFMELYEGLKVLRTSENDDGSIICYYITITNAYSKEIIEKMLMQQLGKIFVLKRLMYNFDVCVNLIYSV